MSRSNQLAGLITATPTATLDTINEINTSLNNDANLSTTLTNSINAKMPLSGGAFTGNVTTTGSIAVDDIIEKTSAHGIEIDGVTLKDSSINGVANLDGSVGAHIGNSHATGYGVKIRGASDSTRYALTVNNNADNTTFMRVLGNGNVGIGSTAPVAPMQIDSNSAGDAALLRLQNKNNTDGDTANILFGFAGNNNANKGGIFFKRTASYGRGSLILATENSATNDNVDNSDAKLTIDSAGNLAIGGVTPVATHTDEVSFRVGGLGMINAPKSATAGKSMRISNNVQLDTDDSYEYMITDEASLYSQYGGAHRFYTASSGTAGNDISWKSPLTLSSDGNVNIGGITGGEQLTLDGGSGINSGYAGWKGNGSHIGFIGGGAGLGASAGDFVVRGTNNIKLNIGTSTKVTLDSSGKVGIGTTSPDANILTGITSGSNSANIYLGATGTGNAELVLDASNGDFSGSDYYMLRQLNDLNVENWLGISGDYIWKTAGGTERMRISSSGGITFPNDTELIFWQFGNEINLTRDWGSGLGTLHFGYRNGSTSSNGNTYSKLAFYGGTSARPTIEAGSYSDVSDYRLKENVTPISESVISKIKSLNPVTFDWKSGDEQTQVGFIAHEVDEVFPLVVTGEKDAMSEKDPDSIQAQCMIMGHLTTYLTKGMQELITRVEALENAS